MIPSSPNPNSPNPDSPGVLRNADSAPNPWSVQTVEIRSMIDEIENVRTLKLAFCDEELGRRYRFQPGQFNMLYLPGLGESAISICSDPTELETVDHTIRIAGNVTSHICNLDVGETLGLRGPFGNGWPMEECKGRDVIMVTGGIGLPPLRPAILEFIRNRELFDRIHLLYGARGPESLVYRNEFDNWSRSGIHVQETVDRSAAGWKGRVGVVTLLLERLEEFDPENTILMCCGPEVMMRFVARGAQNRGLRPDQIWVSTERNMNCAIGLCGHCQLGNFFICKDGPVLRYDRIESLLKVQGL